MRARRGTTLPEILTAMGVLGLLTTGALGVFMPALRGYRAADARFDATRGSLRAIDQMALDMRESAFVSILLGPIERDADGTPMLRWLSMRTARDELDAMQLDTDGSPLWQAYFVYWTEPQGKGLWRLVRARSRQGVPSIDRGGLFSLPDSSGARLIADGVSSWRVDLSSAVTRPRGMARIFVETRRAWGDRVSSAHEETTVDVPI